MNAMPKNYTFRASLLRKVTINMHVKSRLTHEIIPLLVSIKLKALMTMRETHILIKLRLAQNFKSGKFKSATAFSYSLIKRNAEKCKNY